MMTEKWHDLRKDPTDLPKEMDEYWIVVADYPYASVESDSFNPDAIGREMSSPVYNENGQIAEWDHYVSTGWWQYDKPGMVTHWMEMQKPPKPELPKE